MVHPNFGDDSKPSVIKIINDLHIAEDWKNFEKLSPRSQLRLKDPRESLRREFEALSPRGKLQVAELQQRAEEQRQARELKKKLKLAKGLQNRLAEEEKRLAKETAPNIPPTMIPSTESRADAELRIDTEIATADSIAEQTLAEDESIGINSSEDESIAEQRLAGDDYIAEQTFAEDESIAEQKLAGFRNETWCRTIAVPIPPKETSADAGAIAEQKRPEIRAETWLDASRTPPGPHLVAKQKLSEQCNAIGMPFAEDEPARQRHAARQLLFDSIASKIPAASSSDALPSYHRNSI